MAVTNIEEALLDAAQQESLELPSLQNALLAGGALGAGLGVAAGQVPHSILLNVNKLKDHLAGKQGMPRGNRFKGGARVAGGLVGLILGGGLGAAIRNSSMQDSVPAQLLAKLQVQGTLSQPEMALLQQQLGQYYSQPGGIA